MILSGSTKVPTSKTAGEIIGLLGEKGADKIMQEYGLGPNGEREVRSIVFTVAVANGAEMPIRLPVKVDAVMALIERNPLVVESHNRSYLGAQRVAWRMALAWLKAQLAYVEAGMVGMGEVFMPYIALPNGQTFYQQLEANGFKGLPLLEDNKA